MQNFYKNKADKILKNMSKFIELDFELENEILEWSEEYTIDNEALFSLIEILKTRWLCSISLDKSKKIDKMTQSDSSEIFLETVYSLGNSLKDYLEDLKHTQKTILKEIKSIRNVSDCLEGDSILLTNDSQQNNILDFPIKNLNNFHKLENNCIKNLKLYKELMVMFLSNSKFEQCVSVEDTLNMSLALILDPQIIPDLSKFFANTYQLEKFSIFRCLKDAMLEKFPNKNHKDIFKSMLIFLKKYSSEDSESVPFVHKVEENCAEELNETTYSGDNPELDLDMMLPCNTIKDLLKFEDQSKDFGLALTSLFKPNPHVDCRSFIYFVLKKIFGKKIINDIIWEDITGSKTEIKYLYIIEMLIEYALQNFDEVACEDDIVEIVIDWLKYEKEKQNLLSGQKKIIKIKEAEDNIIELEVIGSPSCDLIENNNEMIDYQEEFLEEEDNLFNSLPCKTDHAFRKFEDTCRLDQHFQEKLKELYLSKYEPSDLIDIKYDLDKAKPLTQQFTTYAIQNDFKPFIEYNIRKIATDEIISNFPALINTKSETEEPFDYDDILVLKILRECAQQNFPSLSSIFIKSQIGVFVNKTKTSFKNWSILKKSEECRIKLQKIPPQEIITPDSHSIHLQSIFNLPLNTFESLQDFNIKCLNNEEMSLNLMTMFSQASEYDCNKFVDKNLRKLITENMGGKLTWNGIQENIAIKDLYIMKLLIDATKKYFPNCNEESIIESIKTALRRFKDRIRKRKINVVPTENSETDDLQMHLEQPIYVEIDSDISRLNKIPCRTIKEFQDFEKYCRKCKNLQTNLKKLFDSNPNVDDALKFVSENLKKIVIDSVLSHFTYNGLKNNIGVKYYTVIQILMDSLIGKNPYLSEEDAIRTLKKALLLAKDRQRSMYKKRRKEISE